MCARDRKKDRYTDRKGRRGRAGGLHGKGVGLDNRLRVQVSSLLLPNPHQTASHTRSGVNSYQEMHWLHPQATRKAICARKRQPTTKYTAPPPPPPPSGLPPPPPLRLTPPSPSSRPVPVHQSFALAHPSTGDYPDLVHDTCAHAPHSRTGKRTRETGRPLRDWYDSTSSRYCGAGPG